MEQLTFIPTTGQFFLYDEEAPLPGLRSVVAGRLADAGWPGRAYLLSGGLPTGPVEGTVIELLDALPILAGLPAGDEAPATVAAWAGAARAALDLVVRGRLVPRLRGRQAGPDDERVARWEARWVVAPEAGGADRGLVGRLARELGTPEVAMPAGRQARPGGISVRSYGAAALLRRFLDVCADTLVREASRRGAYVRLGSWPADTWEQRLVRALGDDRPGFAVGDTDPEQLGPELRAWADSEAEGPTLLPSPPSWRAPETLQAVLRRLLAPAALLGGRLLNGEPAPRTLLTADTAAQARLSQSIAVTRALLQLTSATGGKRRTG